MVKVKTYLLLGMFAASCVTVACSKDEGGDDDDDDDEMSGGNGGQSDEGGSGGGGKGGEAGAPANGGLGGGASGGSGGGAGGAAGNAGGAASSAGGPAGSAGSAGGAAGNAGGSAGNAGGMAGMSTTMSFFVTSEKSTTGNLGGIAAADAKCKRLAEAAGVMGKTWAAYLSTNDQPARMRIGTGPWYNQKGVMIAANLAQLHEENGMKNGITQATALTDKGEVVPGRMRPEGTANEHDVLTGSTMAGMPKANATCTNWTAATGASGVGHVDRMGIQDDPVVAASWNAAHEGQCANTTPGGGSGRFYCFAK